MTKLIPPNEVVRKIADWGTKKWHFVFLQDNGLIRTTCNTLFAAEETETETVDNIQSDDICSKCLGAMEAIDY